jgi:hypothetical protein
LAKLVYKDVDAEDVAVVVIVEMGLVAKILEGYSEITA